MIAKPLHYFVCVTMIFLTCFQSFAQEQQHEIPKKPKTNFYNLRGTNAFDFAVGTSVINGDFQDPMFEIYSHVGYKRHLTPHFALDIGYHKFNLAYIDIYNEGFMSFDFNLELILLPHDSFSPFVFAGGGYNASNHFKETALKLQGGIGLEYVISPKIALKLYSDYNYVSSDILDGLEAGASDDTYFRIAFGANFYFGGKSKKEKLLKDFSTEIEENSMTDDNNRAKL